MSTGIGNHKFSRPMDGPYSRPLAICPYCGFQECEADFVDVGVGLVQSGPFYCTECKASEISWRDTRVLTKKEEVTGWYEPGTAVSETANTHNGELVDHHTAALLYRKGMLD